MLNMKYFAFTIFSIAVLFDNSASGQNEMEIFTYWNLRPYYGVRQKSTSARKCYTCNDPCHSPVMKKCPGADDYCVDLFSRENNKSLTLNKKCSSAKELEPLCDKVMKNEGVCIPCYGNLCNGITKRRYEDDIEALLIDKENIDEKETLNQLHT